MGLSAFEECSTPPPYCSPSLDRSLTTRLIESSNNPSKCLSSQFAHTPEWADGLDMWSLSSQKTSTKPETTRRHFDFHRDLGLYLPRHEKPNSAPTSLKALQINTKLTTNHFTPERIRQLLRREKDLLTQNDATHQKLLLDHPPPSLPPPAPANTFRQSTSSEPTPPPPPAPLPQSTPEIRLPLRHVPSKSPLPTPQQPSSSLNQDTLKSLLKEHLTSLLTRGASTINASRTVVNPPSLEIKQQIRTDTKLIEERLTKLEESTPPSSSIVAQQTKTNYTSSPVIFYPRSTLGLTVTPVDLNSHRNFQSISLEKMAQQRNFVPDNDSSSISSRPSTQPAPLPPSPAHLYQQQRITVKRNIEPVNDIENTNKYSEQSQPAQNIRKGLTIHRSSSKTGIHRTAAPTATTIELLPPIISGKRLHIPVANHRYL